MARSKALLNVLNLVDAASSDMPIEKQFLNDLKASIEKQDAKNSRPPSKTYKPSSMHCIRNMYFQVTGAKGSSESATSELVGICESGSDRHERIQQYVCDMKENNIDCEYVNVADYVKSHNLDYLNIVSQQGYETKLYYPELNMSFLCDGIIRYKGKYYILEIKTETSNKFWDRKDVNPDHILQGTAYSLAFGINEVLFLYECRDNCSKKAFMLNVTDDMRMDLAGKITNCDSYVKSGKIPPKPADITKKACAYCGYCELCNRSE
jgi:CRISPR/Cas system-associated exonuclease Cas4 (RecB family)